MLTHTAYGYSCRLHLLEPILEGDKTMLKRLGLVIHWAGFLTSLGVMGVLIATYERTGVWAGNATDSGLLILVAPPLLGWIVRFILTGHKNPLPWVANKEAV